MSTLRQFNTPISLSSAALSATHNSNTVANIFTTGGNVGIGTTSPSGLLDARGTGFWGIVRTIPSSFGGESSIGFISNPDGSIGTGPTTSNWLLGTNITGYPLGQFNIKSNALGTASIFTIATNGNIGIGTTAPGYTLDVNGTLEASNSNGFMLFGTSGNIFIGSTTPTPSAFGRGNLMLYGTAATNSGIAMDGVCNTTLQFFNSGTMKGALALVATAGNWSPDSRVGDMVIRCASNQSMLFNTNSGTGVSTMIISGGNIGIGTTSPTTTLDVNGTINTSNISTGTFFASTSRIGVMGGQDGGPGRGIHLLTTNDTNWAIYAATNGANKSIANGTAVAGAGGITNYAFRMRVPNVSTQGFVWENSNEQLLASIRGSDGLSYFAGNVGIATTNPSYTLDVNGTLEASNTNGVMLFASSGNIGINTTTANFASIEIGNGYNNVYTLTTGNIRPSIAFAWNSAGYRHFITSRHNSAASSNQNAIDFWLNNSSTSTAATGPNASTSLGMSVTATGVGIGTTSPSTRLHVNGAITASYASGGYTSDGGNFNKLTNGAGVAMVELRGNDMYLTSNVGIGTNSPRSALDVNGDIITDWANRFIGTRFTDGADYNLGMFTNVATRALDLRSMSGDNTGPITFSTGTGPTERMRITSGGIVSIGNNNPNTSTVLFVAAGANGYSWPTSGYYFTPTMSTLGYGGAGGGSSSPNQSILALGAITSAVGFFATSDIRIKKIIKQGIQEIDISQIDKLDITKFEYIDKLAHGNDVKLGFIAQNVHEVLPEAVTIRKEFVPNIFKVTSVNDKVIELESHNLTVGTRVKIMVDEQDRNGTVTEITNIIDENHFCIEYDLDSKDKLFIYGTEVDDFKELNYNHIFTLSVGAVQKLRQDYRNVEHKFDKLTEFIQAKFPNEFIL